MQSKTTTTALGHPAPLARPRLVALALAASAFATPAHALGDGFKPSFGISGFGTLGIAHSSEKEADFVAHDLQGGGAGRDHEWSTDVDSKLGLQLTANLTEKLTGVVQVLSTQRYDGTFRPGIEWANLKYNFTPELSLRVGRSVLGTFLASDYRNVGYALPWVRPPVEVYGLVPMTSNDGVDLSYRLTVGDAIHTFQAAYGNTEDRLPGGGKSKSRGGWMLSDTVEYGAATFRVVYTRADVSLDFDDTDLLFAGYESFARDPGVQLAFPDQAARAAAIVDKYDMRDMRTDFIGVGASYDPGKWFVMAEWGQTNTRSAYGKRTAWYASGGYRIGKFTPYVTYSRADLKSNGSDPGIAVPDPRAARLNAGLNAILAGAPVQKTVSIGIRWDFARNAAFKLQYDHSDISGRSPGTLDHQTPDFRPGGRFDVWSATIDFVF